MPIISSQIYNNNGAQLLGTIENTDVNAFYLKSDGVYRNDTLELAISNFVGLTQTINGTTPDSGYAVPTPSGNGVALDTSMGETVWYAIQGSSNIQIPITKNGKTTLATKGTKNAEDIDINVDISPTIQSLSITPSETSQTFNASNVDGYKPVNVSAIQTETPTVNLSLASGNQTVNASSGKYIKSLTITKPSTLIASNIKSGVNIAGVNGNLSPAKPEQTKSTTITENGATTVTPDSGQVLSSVEITTNVPTYITVASESALPSTAQEGTIAVVEGVAMYSVSCSSYGDKVDTSLQTYYSTNNGSTWTEFTNTGILSNKTNQIKFRMTYPSGTPGIGTATLSSEQLGMTLSHSFSSSGFDVTSDNYILTEDITDVTYNEDL